jgi:transposase
MSRTQVEVITSVERAAVECLREGAAGRGIAGARCRGVGAGTRGRASSEPAVQMATPAVFAATSCAEFCSGADHCGNGGAWIAGARRRDRDRVHGGNAAADHRCCRRGNRVCRARRTGGEGAAVMIAFPAGVRVWLATGHTGFDGLALPVQEQPKRDPHSGQLFVFRGRRGGLIKIIWHDGQGICLFAKRLERGRWEASSASGRRGGRCRMICRANASRIRRRRRARAAATRGCARSART